MLYLYQRTMFGKIENEERAADLSHREFATFAPLLVFRGVDGAYPAPFLNASRLGAPHHGAREPRNAGECSPRATQAADWSGRGLGQSRREVPVTMPCDVSGNPLPAAAADKAEKR